MCSSSNASYPRPSILTKTPTQPTPFQPIRNANRNIGEASEHFSRWRRRRIRLYDRKETMLPLRWVEMPTRRATETYYDARRDGTDWAED